MQIVSWYNLGMYKTSIWITELPENDRSSITQLDLYEKECDNYIFYWKEYDPNINFFLQLSSLRKSCKLPHILRWWPVENSNYAGTVWYSNNVYLSFEVFACDKVLYSVNVKDSCDYILNSTMVGSWSHNVFQSFWIFNSSDIFYSIAVTDSYNVFFSINLLNCEECIWCQNLEYKKYCINNKQYEKKEYFEKKKNILKNKNLFSTYYEAIKEKPYNLWSENTKWQLAINCQNSENIYLSHRLTDSHNTVFVGTETWNSCMYDVASAWAPYWNHYYGMLWAGRWDHYYCSYSIEWCNNIYYSYFMIDCSFCLWCVGLKNKSYCILNKQYTKEERYQKVDEIFAQMEADGALWQFFPAIMNPFYFNDTAAYLIDSSFTKEEVVAKWYLWRDEPIKVDVPSNAEIVNSSDLWKYEWFDSEWNRVIDSNILEKVIQDNDWNVWKVVKSEYDFLLKYGLPLPRKHWLDRIKDNFRIS